MLSLISAIKIIFFVCFIVFCVQYWMQNKTFLTDHNDIAEIARKHTGTKDIQVSYKQIYKELKKRFPGHILPEEDTEWLFMNAGGWMGSMCLLYASLTEYILFFGTAIDTSGNSGRYWANISDTILKGSFRQWKEGELESKMFKPGDTVYHEWGEVTAVQWEGGTWMVEYARGFIPSTLGFALADTLFSTTDFVNLFYIMRVYTKALILEASTSLLEWKEFTKESL
ncbi:sigma non-opioid intracellular receptor 1-like [Mytilus californianus]|uniref:sigma non-opioid intracellular receptor 1-like n=1 Tax=Mytilus californianus TaxID=6549 RepID=UPI00224822E5|nr:sigma non-opioid intracellular receptor 1-like [Mytilus californianus]